jgi:dTMP kinase
MAPARTGSPSLLIAVEGLDGAGKRTQAVLLQEAARRHGMKAGMLSFPRYGETLFARCIEEYLNGRFGRIDTIPPRSVALLYAGDRFESREVLQAARAHNDVTVLDRYVASNLAYQGARLTPDQRAPFFTWLVGLEYEVYGLPRPDAIIYLDVPAEIASDQVRSKSPRAYTDRVADIVEENVTLLAACREVYEHLIDAGIAGRWIRVECAPGGMMRPPEAIHRDVLTGIESLTGFVVS